MIVWNVWYKEVKPLEVVIAALVLFCTQHEESILYVSYQHQGEEAPCKISFKCNHFKEFVETNNKLF